jgi:hypothetical protein
MPAPVELRLRFGQRARLAGSAAAFLLAHTAGLLQQRQFTRHAHMLKRFDDGRIELPAGLRFDPRSAVPPSKSRRGGPRLPA